MVAYYKTNFFRKWGIFAIKLVVDNSQLISTASITEVIVSDRHTDRHTDRQTEAEVGWQIFYNMADCKNCPHKQVLFYSV